MKNTYKAILVAASSAAIGATAVFGVATGTAGPEPRVAASEVSIDAAANGLVSFPIAAGGQLDRGAGLVEQLKRDGEVPVGPSRELGTKGPFKAVVAPLKGNRFCIELKESLSCTTAEGFAPFTAWGFDPTTGLTTLQVVATGGVDKVLAISDSGSETPVSISDGTGQVSFKGQLAAVSWNTNGQPQRRDLTPGIALGPLNDR